MTTKAQIAEREDAIRELNDLLDDGDMVWTILRHVSKSGMSRSISTIIIDCDGEPFDASYMVARATGRKIDPKNHGVKVQGCGMDMGFELVYTLACVMFGHVDLGGYKLNQRWL